MNYRVVFYIIGRVLQIEAALLLLPCLVALYYGEPEGLMYLAVAGGALLVSLPAFWLRPKNMTFYVREGFVTVALSWIILSLVGCLPFRLTGEIRSITDALFETISGFTTTGSSILPDVEALSRCSLFWRSFTHWIGGMGVLVFLLAILPMTGGSQMQLMRAESPGPSVGKLVPRVRSTAKILYLIYLGLTGLQILFLMAGKMPLFDALATTFGTAGTGGFGIKADSMASYSPYLQWVVTVFMILFGINFNVYFFLLIRRWRQALGCEEMRWYLIIIAAATALIFANLMFAMPGLSAGETLRHSAFQVASIITTTGFATTDFALWPVFSRTILVVLMFIGACAGSTGGGIKVSRIVILVKTVKKELETLLHPRCIRKLKFEGKSLEHNVNRSINVYLVTFFLIFTLSILLVSLEGKDLITTFTAVATTLNNVGPGLELAGPTQNFGHFSTLSKYVMMFDMLAGRLELFPMLLLFYPPTWKERGHRPAKPDSQIRIRE